MLSETIGLARLSWHSSGMPIPDRRARDTGPACDLGWAEAAGNEPQDEIDLMPCPHVYKLDDGSAGAVADYTSVPRAWWNWQTRRF